MKQTYVLWQLRDATWVEVGYGLGKDEARQIAIERHAEDGKLYVGLPTGDHPLGSRGGSR